MGMGRAELHLHIPGCRGLGELAVSRAGSSRGAQEGMGTAGSCKLWERGWNRERGAWHVPGMGHWGSFGVERADSSSFSFLVLGVGGAGDVSAAPRGHFSLCHRRVT